MIELNGSIQLEREIRKASTSSKTYYDQLATHPKDVRKYNSSHRIDSGNHGEYQCQRYDDFYEQNHVIIETDHDQLVDSSDTIHKAQIDSEIIHAIVMTAHAH